MINSHAKSIVITGCSYGIGRALTEEFIRLGHFVYGGARSKDALAHLTETYPHPHLFATLDVSDPKSVHTWSARILEQTTPDILINNAAQILTPAKLWEIDNVTLQNLVKVNILGTMYVCRAFVPSLLQKGQGIIVNLSSGAGRMGIPDIGAYCTTKWAIEGFSKSLQADLPPSIGVIPLNPGIVDTQMLRTIWNEGASQAPEPQPWARTAAQYILSLNPSQGGQSLTIPNAS